MTAYGLLAVSFIMNVVAVLFVLCCIALVLIVLIQKGKGGGLSGAFGGMSSGILGSKTGDFLTWVTIILAGVFLGLAVIMAKFYKEEVSDYGTGQSAQQQAPAGQRQAAATGEPQVTPGMADDGNAAGGSDAGGSEIPVTSEQEVPTGSTMTESGGTGEQNEVNLPGN